VRGWYINQFSGLQLIVFTEEGKDQFGLTGAAASEPIAINYVEKASTRRLNAQAKQIAFVKLGAGLNAPGDFLH
jgi:hypothetical protein